MTVAFFDSGVDGTNAMVASRWRGLRTSIRASWFDPFLRASAPQDLVGHGTQVAVASVGGLATGDTLRFPDGTRIVAQNDVDVVTGPAPRAEWIAARVFERFGGTIYTRRSVLLQAFQWALDPDGNPASEDAPDVINNSWGLLPDTDIFDTCNDILYQAIDAAEAAGIAVVFAAGNTGPAPSSVAPPGARDDAALRSLAVGASEGSDQTIGVADFSGRGPSPCGGGVKPEIIAPGIVPEVRGDGPGAARLTGFAVQGTSFSTAQVTGALALMRQVRPAAGPEEAKRLLLDSAADLPPVGPDNDAGYGLLDVPAAVQRANPSFAVGLLQLLTARRSADTVELEIVNRGSLQWPGGVIRMEIQDGASISGDLPAIPPGAGVLMDVAAGSSGALRVTVLDRSGGIVLSRWAYAGPPNNVGGFVLRDGTTEVGGNDFGRFGRIAAPTGFLWQGQELLPAASLFVAGGGRISDGIYTTVLGRSDLKSSPPAAETDWAPLRTRTDVETSRAEFQLDDFEALLPVGVEVAARADVTDTGTSRPARPLRGPPSWKRLCRRPPVRIRRLPYWRRTEGRWPERPYLWAPREREASTIRAPACWWRSFPSSRSSTWQRGRHRTACRASEPPPTRRR